MLRQTDKPIPDQEELAAMVKASLSEHQRVIQRTLAVLAATNAAIERLEERTRRRGRA